MNMSMQVFLFYIRKQIFSLHMEHAWFQQINGPIPDPAHNLQPARPKCINTKQKPKWGLTTSHSPCHQGKSQKNWTLMSSRILHRSLSSCISCFSEIWRISLHFHTLLFLVPHALMHPLTVIDIYQLLYIRNSITC